MSETTAVPEKKSNGRKPAPAARVETKREKFVRVCSKRFDSIVHAIHVMRALGRNQAQYEYGDVDIDQITDLLVAELNDMKAEMKRRGRPIQVKLDLSH